MKNLKRSVSVILAAAMAGTMLVSAPVMAADGNGIDIALTNTNYSAIGESGKITVCRVEDGQRGAEITSGLTFTSSDEGIVGSIDENGRFTTNGFGVARIEIVYDNGTAGDTADDIRSAVMINCYDGSLQNAVMQRVYVDDENKVQTGLDKKYYSASSLIDKEDPMQSGRYVIGESNNTSTVGITKNNAELGENVDSAVFNGWFYDDASYVSALGFTYAAKYAVNGSFNTTVANLRDSKYSFTLNVDALTGVSPAPYMVTGGRYSMQNVRQEYVTVSDTQNNKGALSDISRSKGWHQMTAITEPSMIMPGDDYKLVKVYIDGELVTCQDIYVGTIPADERAFGFFLNGQNVNQSKFVYYDDIVITKYTTSNAVRDIIPSNGAKNVPVSSDIKIKFADKVNADSSSFVLSGGNGNVKIKTELDKTGTVVTIKPSKLDANTEYTLSAGSSLAWADGTAVGDISYSFTTSGSTALADAVANMNEYEVQSARSIDFADTQKNAMEYGVGFMYGYAGTSSRINADGSATFKEGIRKAVAAAKQNQLVVRNISDINAAADRVVVSYKFKPDIEQINSATSFGGGLGIPYMALKDTAHKYDDRTVGFLSGGKTDVFPCAVGKVNGNTLARMYLLAGNRTGGDTAYHENAVQDEDGNWKWNSKNAANGNVAFLENAEQSASNAVNFVPDKDGYYRLTYVLDVDTAGQLYPKWTVVFGEDFENRDNIFALHVEPINKTAYTSVDSLTIPLLKSSEINAENSLSVKDIEIYNLKKSTGVKIDNTITVKDSQSGIELEPNEVAGKKVDIELKASGNGENYTTIAAAYDNDNTLLNVALISGSMEPEQSNIGVSNFEVPQNSARVRVFVWDSFENGVPIMPKIDYTLTE